MLETRDPRRGGTESGGAWKMSTAKWELENEH